ncbi:Alpha,alpha-trehalose-phosphate synthase [UDP-forming] 1-like protein [Gossypium australe]|uniref:Alpha,alpha-trehalose-phosphate synthase [UDP-forming] 1-like protein n=1 Tax=Gossypium australe TaxID=47621 RepID=A0A5B6UEG6_9ROSI|nr:Alpha,alpha-trehalose-phosphate synthase [UDP-forming] 1-like protein [Gossypium australe]
MQNACAVFSEKCYGNMLLAGYGLNHKHESALIIFGDMIEWLSPKSIIFHYGLEALDKAKEILAMVIMRSLDSDVFVGNSLVVLYTICGNTNDAGAAFYNVGEKNVVLWNSVLVDVHNMVKLIRPRLHSHGCSLLAAIPECCKQPDAFFSILVYINSLR